MANTDPTIVLSTGEMLRVPLDDRDSPEDAIDCVYRLIVDRQTVWVVPLRGTEGRWTRINEDHVVRVDCPPFD